MDSEPSMTDDHIHFGNYCKGRMTSSRPITMLLVSALANQIVRFDWRIKKIHLNS